MKARLKQMEEEAEKLKELQTDHPNLELSTSTPGAPAGAPTAADADARSVYVGNVDYASTPEELQAHFQDCGTICRVTILCNKYTGQPKGFAYLEFADEDAVKNAMILNESLFRGRQLKVSEKRTNVPGMGPAFARGGGRGRGRGMG
eukprot:CAMPEP_0174889348 /NCGR_PEP_ID=MMETSP0167-20121228/4614_1 /TAXON_ID=38298 /ORGANISM="Rhodella maculata, Strain CCMP736" /LENGTH=146 /DNA_ID=CAMNT_0016126723 /DNA_START=167 /DNA_END=603 /DNA_ORIENTATION=+